MTLLRSALPLLGLIFLAGCGQPPSVESKYPWAPSRPLQIVVPWAAGGSTDQIIRVLAGEIERALGTNVVVVNTPGASGSIGTRGVLQGRKDGLTWASGAAAGLGTFKLLGLLDTDLDDWHLFLAVSNVSVLSVPTDSPYQDFGQFLAALKAKPSSIRVATAGVASSGHHAIEALAQGTQTEYRHVPYAGGNPAIISTVAGETDATTQLATEQAEMIRGKRLRPLVVFASEALEIEDHGTVPPITQWLPDLHYSPTHFGIWASKDVPAEVIETMEQIWREQIAKSETIQRYARQQGAFFTPLYGAEARAQAFEKIREDAWSLHRSGQAKVSPADVGIPEPATARRP